MVGLAGCTKTLGSQGHFKSRLLFEERRDKDRGKGCPFLVSWNFEKEWSSGLMLFPLLELKNSASTTLFRSLEQILKAGLEAEHGNSRSLQGMGGGGQYF